MLYIEVIRSNKITESVTWHIGMSRPKIHEPDTITSVQADCDELEYIQRRFINLPMSHNRVNLWRGELATFIVDNL